MAAEININSIFRPTSQSISAFITVKGQGCYIPAYQRAYAWNRKNITRLFEDVMHGIRQITSRPNTISFLGTIIAIHDNRFQTVKPIYRTEVAPRVMTIIDGQQRICTVVMTNIVLHDYISRAVKQIQGRAVKHLAWIHEECDQVLKKLKDTYLLDQSDDGNCSYYPRVIRAHLDVWSLQRNQAKYESPVAKLIWEYINFSESGNDSQFNLNLGNNQRYKSVQNAFHIIQNEVKRICQSHIDKYDFPNLVKMTHESSEGIWNSALPDEVTQYVYEASNSRPYKHFCNLLRLLIFARYLNHRMAVTVVTATNEDDAFSMFEALNTTGEPLTAFETLKPKVVEREQLSKYEETESYTWVTQIEEYLNRYHKTDDRQRFASDMLVHFALLETGTRLQKTLKQQRYYLHNEFDKLTKDSSLEKNRSFLKSLATLASFLDNLWNAEAGTKPDFASLNIEDEEALVGFQVLRELRHSITIAPLCRFYQHLIEAEGETDRTKRTEDFIAAIKATTAFSILWRGAKGKTRNIDSHYREIMRSGVHSCPEPIPPLARCINGISGFPLIDEYKKALCLVLQGRGQIQTRDEWVSQSSRIAIYEDSKVLTRFLILCASDDTIPHRTDDGLLEKARSGINSLPTLKSWNDTAHLTVEHVAPKSPLMEWDTAIYDDAKTVNTLGNLILLPKEVNEIIGNKSWKHKKSMYSLFSAETPEEFSERKTKLQSVGLNFAQTTGEVLANAKYLGLCKSVALYDNDWALDIIQRRSRCLAELAWDRLEKWLFQ